MRVLLLLLFCASAFGITMKERALAERWTFTFDEKAPPQKTGLIHKENENMGKVYHDFRAADVTIPDTYDLRSQLSPIRQQGACGSCWAFAIVAAVRDANLIYNKDPGAISEQYMVDCAKDMLGCNGGTMSASNWVVEPKGAPLLSAYPYTARNGRCQNKGVAGSIIEWHNIGASRRKPTNEEIQKALLLYGPIVITIGADTPMANYKSGVFNACRGTGTNHMIDIVGWNNTEGYWIVRNSWGTTWGENGFGKIKFGCNHIADEAAYFVVHTNPVPPTPKEFLMESASLSIRVTISAQSTVTVDKAKSTIQTFLNNLDRSAA